MVVRIPVRFEMWRGAPIETTDRFWRKAVMGRSPN